MSEFAGPVIAGAFMLVVWFLTRRSKVVDDLGSKREKLAESYIKAEQGLLDRLEQRIVDLDDELRSERKECEKRQDALELEVDALHDQLNALKALLIRHNIPVPGSSKRRRDDHGGEGAA